MPPRRVTSEVSLDTDPLSAPRKAAVSLLARRDLTPHLLAVRLRGRGFEAAAVAEIIRELSASGVLNEARYAQNFIAYHAGRGQGPVRIARELREAGLTEAAIEAALADGPDWRALARQVRRGRFGAAEPSSWPERARQARFLQYRGFSADHIRAATGADPDPDTGPPEP